MKQHKIGWLNIPGYIPATYNPIVGCTKVSPGCKECYAEKMAARLATMPAISYKYAPVVTGRKWNGKTFMDETCLDNPTRWRKPYSIFVCSMGDLFHESIPFHQIDAVWDVMCCNPQHIYIVLTKRYARALEYFQYLNDVRLKDFGGYEAPDFIWIGVTAENQEMADERIPILLQIPAAKRFVSCEPLLGSIDLNNYLYNRYHMGGERHMYNKLDWVIAGPETGPKARAMDLRWITGIWNQCQEAEIPFFDKKNTLKRFIEEFPNR